MIEDLIIIIGAYGSGKSEYSIHLSRKLHAQGKDVILADLDVVNPYFRSREIRSVFSIEGIEVIAPEGEFTFADLPMISPRIMGAIENYQKTVILDVGGDPAGCRTLGRFVEAIKTRGYQMKLIVNTKRPFTSSTEEIITMLEMLEFSSKLKVTELICNTNLMEFTNNDIIAEGIQIVTQVSKITGISFTTYLMLDKYDSVCDREYQGLKKEIMTYALKKPWEVMQ